MKVVVEEFPEGKFFRILKNIKYNLSKYILIPAAFLIIFPIVALFIKISAFYITQNLVIKRSIAAARSYLIFINTTNSLVGYVITSYSKIPLIGNVYDQLNHINRALARSSEIGIEKINASTLIINVVNKTLNKENFSPDSEGREIILTIDNVLEKESFGRAESNAFDNELFLRKISQSNLFETFPGTGLLLKYKDIAGIIGSLLGENEVRNYALVFQDESTIRVTGGIIKSVALVTFRGGNMESISFYKPDEIDSHITGEVIAPYPLNRNGSKWNFEDANWASDFAQASIDVEWYLEKSLGIKTDGVVFVNKTISSKGELESLIQTYLKLNKTQRLNVLNDILLDNRKDFLIYLNEPDELKVFDNIGMSKTIPNVVCNGCFRDFLGIIESDISANKYNSKVSREAELKISIQDGIVKKKLSLNLKRTNNDERQHELYLRFVVPNAMSFSPVDIDGEKYLGRVETIGRSKQLGILVNMSNDEKDKTVRLDFEGSLPNRGNISSYLFDWISQPGLLNFSSQLSFEQKNIGPLNINTNESLTRTGDGVYNTLLVPFNRDIKLNVYY